MEDFETLSDVEKAASIRSKIKTIQYQKYNLELDVISENAVSSPNLAMLETTQNQLNDMAARETALLAELQKFDLSQPAN